MTTDPQKNGTEAEERLADALEQILRGDGDSATASADELLASHPELAGDLESCLRAIAYLGSVGRTGTPPPRRAGVSAEPEARVLGDYRILREIGRGGMGIVFETEELSLGRRVALKVLPWATLLDRRQRERFRNEARLAAQLHHSNIVPVFSVGTEQGIDYYAMQYIDGEPLAEWIKQQRGSRAALVEAVVSLGIQAADALAYAHQTGVVHRDIKPSNLLVDRAGKLWITDFGVARSQSPLGLTATGDRVGTLHYMSPEQYAGEAIDYRTDIYALRVTLRELLAPVPNGSSLDEPEETGTTDSYPAWQHGSKRHRLPRDLETILRKSTAPARRDRYPNAQEMADDLRHFLHGEPIAAQRPGLLTIGAKWVLRHRWLAATSLVATLLTLVGLAAATTLVWSQRLEAERQRDRAQHLLAVHQADQAVRHLENGDSAGLLELVQAGRTAERDSRLTRDIESLWSRWHAVHEGRLVQVLGHDQPVVAVAYSPDNRLLATASVDSTVVLWDVPSGQRRAVLAHAHPVTVISFDEEGGLLATGDASGSVQVWNVLDGKQVGPVREHSGGAVCALAFRPGARALAVATAGSNVAYLWEIDHDAEPVVLRHGGTVRRIQFINRGPVLAVAAGAQVCFWNVDSGQFHSAPIKLKHTADVMCASPDGSFVAVGGPDGIAGVWHIESGREVDPEPRHDKRLLDMQFSPDGRWMATAHADHTVRRWDTSTWQVHGEPLRHAKQITAIVFSPDSRFVASASSDGGVRIWAIDSGALQSVTWHQGVVRSIAFDNSGTRIATAADDSTARIWNLNDTGRGILLRHTSGVRTLAASADNQFLVTGTTDGQVTCWKLATREVCWRAKAHRDRVTSVAVSSDGALIASASEDCTVRLWSTISGKPYGKALRFPEGVKALAFQPHAETLVIGCNDKTVTLWEFSCGQRRELFRDDEAVKALAVDEQGRTYAYGTNGAQTHVRSLHGAGELIASLPHGDRIRSVRFSPASVGLLAIGGEDGVVRLWSLPGFSQHGSPLEQGGEVYDLDINSTTSLLATAIRDRTFVRIWDLTTTLACDGVLLKRSGQPLAVLFTPDGRWLASGWADGACWLWPLPELPTNHANMERKTRLALGARLGADSRAVAIPWDEWQDLRTATALSKASFSSPSRGVTTEPHDSR